MKKIIKVLLIILAIIMLGIGVLVISFKMSMRSDPKEEAKVKKLALKYLDKTYSDEISVYGTLRDNMGNFTFEYAARAENKKDHTQFLVYYNDELNQMTDTYIAEKWENELKKNIQLYVREKLVDLDEFNVMFDERVGENVDLNNPGSYKDSNESPYILISISRKRNKTDEALFNEILSYIKDDAKLKHGTITIDYVKKGVPLEKEAWRKEF